MTSVQLLTSALAGLGLGLGLIVAIGAQNAFVLRQGIRREQVLTVVVICIVSDAVLIAAGVAGAGALFTALPWLVDLARWGGALFLLAYAAMAARRSWRRPAPDAHGLEVETRPGGHPSGGGTSDRRGPTPLEGRTPAPSGESGTTLTVQAPAPAPEVATVRAPRKRLGVVATALALTWLNPHVYLDTFVLLGSVGSTHGENRWAFAAGAVVGSIVWFSSLGLAARALAPVFARPRAWRVLDAGLAVVMTSIAVGLVVGA
ncbi:LysE/ArgO family amino acid transporter [Oryzobacter telluris]|uniref:LysE/ArgO family amino acid transporter n=1 Tax=Oryzobacter telluris TaxID=3149179 RepID=UPI00370DAA1E